MRLWFKENGDRRLAVRWDEIAFRPIVPFHKRRSRSIDGGVGGRFASFPGPVGALVARRLGGMGRELGAGRL